MRTTKDYQKIKQVLYKDYGKHLVDRYASYVEHLDTDKNKNGKLKNMWMQYRSNKQLINYFVNVAIGGLYIDGKHITIISTGVSLDYKAYRNKMLLAYPESKIDIGLVYEGDDPPSFHKKDGAVLYDHIIKNPFTRKDSQIIGGYCIIKNKRGEFLTTLTKADFEKHRKIAKTDKVWEQWYVEMCKKTLIKKACSDHFDDIFQNINEIDNNNIDLELPLEIDQEIKTEIEKLETRKEVAEYWKSNSADFVKNREEFNKLCEKRVEVIENDQA